MFENYVGISHHLNVMNTFFLFHRIENLNFFFNIIDTLSFP